MNGSRILWSGASTQQIAFSTSEHIRASSFGWSACEHYIAVCCARSLPEIAEKNPDAFALVEANGAKCSEYMHSAIYL